MAVNLLQIAAAYNRTYTTTCKHIRALIKQGKFEKTSPGKQYNEKEIKKLERLMDFTYKPQN